MAAIGRIVLIDDNDADNEFHEIMIRKAGFVGEVVVIDNPLRVEGYLSNADLNVPTYIFLDINMPMMDGFQVAAQITPMLLDHPTMVVMMLTSSSSQKDRDQATQIGIIKGFITKPLTDTMVKEFLAGHA